LSPSVSRTASDTHPTTKGQRVDTERVTDTQTLTLAGFLLARIAEDEDPVNRDVHRIGCGECSDEEFTYCNCDYPARVLAECEAKRRIVARHRHEPTAVVIARAWGNETRTLMDCDTCCETEEYADTDGWCSTLRLLAIIYSDHPDYRQEWAV
jgi:hypothetical protein